MRKKAPEKPSASGNVKKKKLSESEAASQAGTAPASPEPLSSERYQAFVENIGEGVYEIDILGHFTYFNNSLARIFGYPPEEILYRSFSIFMDEDYARKGFDTFNKIYRTGEGINDMIWEIRRKDGSTRIIELSANLVVNKASEKTGFRGIVRDISERYRAREALKKSERRYRTLLEFAPYPIVVFNQEGCVGYLNPSFTEVFGWTLDELKGKEIPFYPAEPGGETGESVRRLFQEKGLKRYETKRLTKDGRLLDVVIRDTVLTDEANGTSMELMILRDVTHEKRLARNTEALLRIGMALPQYPELEDLLDYVSNEIKNMVDSEGALVILLDHEKNELFFKSGAHDDSATERKIKEIRYPADKGVSAEVLRTGQPIIVKDAYSDPKFYTMVDRQAGFNTRSLLDVPLREKDRIIGVLCAINKKSGDFDQTDIELLNMIAGTVALSIENARFAEELKEAYKEVTALNRAKDKVINHLSHELRTPLSVLAASLTILEKRLAQVPPEAWKPTMGRAERNLNRILEMQYQLDDIIRDSNYQIHQVATILLESCTDLLEALAAERVGEGPLVEAIRKRIDDLFVPEERPVERILPHEVIPRILDEIEPRFSHRSLDIQRYFTPAPAIEIPMDVLEKVVTGLVKNAVENTPDHGRIELRLHQRGKGAELVVQDFGVGITEENQRRIFEGFFSTQETMAYSSKHPYEFNAGGKGADLLRMKIFSERYHFRIDMNSTRCRFIPLNTDVCPGDIEACTFCRQREDCLSSGGTTFRVFFPAADQDSLSGGDGPPDRPDATRTRSHELQQKGES
ncbi:PAS domain S-box protein [Desulfatiglans anilini]|uniref:PAS domain S-box protein n=1 Tax=Desulfatiglans anilini TaxID=90728 RepID=UPI00041B2525|nr:PAS domain S-box protein [Desulfatiglans anilini]